MLLFSKKVQNVFNEKQKCLPFFYIYKQNGDFLKQKISDLPLNNTLAFYVV